MLPRRSQQKRLPTFLALLLQTAFVGVAQSATPVPPTSAPDTPTPLASSQLLPSDAELTILTTPAGVAGTLLAPQPAFQITRTVVTMGVSQRIVVAVPTVNEANSTLTIRLLTGPALLAGGTTAAVASGATSLAFQNLQVGLPGDYAVEVILTLSPQANATGSLAPTELRTSFVFDVSTSIPTHLRLVTDNGVFGHVGGKLFPQPVLRLEDRLGKATPDPGNGTFCIVRPESSALVVLGSTRANTTQDPSTFAFETLRIDAVGEYRLVASVTLSSGQTLTTSFFVTVTRVKAYPTRGVSQGSAQGEVDAVFNVPVQLTLTDSTGTPVPSDARGTLVVTSSPPGGDIVGRLTESTDVTGTKLTFGSVTATVEGTYVVKVVVSGNGVAFSATGINVVIKGTEPQPTCLCLLKPPLGRANHVLSQPPVIALSTGCIDTSCGDRLIPSAGSQIFLSKTDGPSQGVMTGFLSPAMDVEGRFTFPDLSFSRAGLYQLEAKARLKNGALLTGFKTSCTISDLPLPSVMLATNAPFAAAAGDTIFPDLEVELLTTEGKPAADAGAQLTAYSSVLSAGGVPTRTATPLAVDGTSFRFRFFNVSLDAVGIHRVEVTAVLSNGDVLRASVRVMVGGSGAARPARMLVAAVAAVGTPVVATPRFRLADQYGRVMLPPGGNGSTGGGGANGTCETDGEVLLAGAAEGWCPYPAPEGALAAAPPPRYSTATVSYRAPDGVTVFSAHPAPVALPAAHTCTDDGSDSLRELLFLPLLILCFLLLLGCVYLTLWARGTGASWATIFLCNKKAEPPPPPAEAEVPDGGAEEAEEVVEESSEESEEASSTLVSSSTVSSFTIEAVDDAALLAEVRRRFPSCDVKTQTERPAAEARRWAAVAEEDASEWSPLFTGGTAFPELSVGPATPPPLPSAVVVESGTGGKTPSHLLKKAVEELGRLELLCAEAATTTKKSSEGSGGGAPAAPPPPPATSEAAPAGKERGKAAAKPAKTAGALASPPARPAVAAAAAPEPLQFVPLRGNPLLFEQPEERPWAGGAEEVRTPGPLLGSVFSGGGSPRGGVPSLSPASAAHSVSVGNGRATAAERRTTSEVAFWEKAMRSADEVEAAPSKGRKPASAAAPAQPPLHGSYQVGVGFEGASGVGAQPTLADAAASPETRYEQMRGAGAGYAEFGTPPPPAVPAVAAAAAHPRPVHKLAPESPSLSSGSTASNGDASKTLLGGSKRAAVTRFALERAAERSSREQASPDAAASKPRRKGSGRGARGAVVTPADQTRRIRTPAMSGDTTPADAAAAAAGGEGASASASQPLLSTAVMSEALPDLAVTLYADDML